MRIRKLALQNFRNHERLFLDLDRFTFIIGSNAAGKSSIAEAISILFTGRCARTEAAGVGQDEPIRTGAREYVINALLEPGPMTIQRSRDRRSQSITIDNNVVPSALAQARICEGLAPLDVLSALFDSGSFLSMDERDQKTMLANVLAADAPTIPDAIVSDIKAIARNDSAQFASIMDIDRAYTAYFNIRTDAKRNLKSLGDMEPLGEAEYDSPDVWKRLDDLRNERESLQQQRARSDERHQSAELSTQTKIDTLRSRLDAARQAVLSDADCTALQKIADGADAVAALNARAATLARQIEKRKYDVGTDRAGRLAAARNTLHDATLRLKKTQERAVRIASATDSDCPTCSRPLSRDDRVAIGSMLDNLAGELNQEITGAEQKIAAISSEFDETTDQMLQTLRELGDEINRSGDPVAAAERLRVNREALVSITKIERELADVKHPIPPDLSSFDTEIKTLNERIAKGEAIWEKCCQQTGDQVAYVAWKDKKAALESHILTLDRLVDFFGPHGIKAQMIGDKIGPFTKSLNEYLGKFGYSVSFSIDPYAFIVNTLALKQLSKSEQFRFSIAFQIALALVTGIKFVVIDEADILQPSSRAELFDLLVNSDLDQAIVLSTSEDEAPRDQMPEGIRFLTLRAKAVAA